MGRTKRRRSRNRKQTRCKNLDAEDAIVYLCKWMKRYNWNNNTCLHLRQFETTGRGIYSKRKFSPGDYLIQVPYDLLITLKTVQESLEHILNLSEKWKLKFQDLLILFLIVERSKGFKSKWYPYIHSLPLDPPWLPHTLSQEETEALPADLKEKINHSRLNFEESWKRIQKSINSWDGSGRCVLSVNSFKWAFAMVNTRAVYVDPGIIHELSQFPGRDLRPFLSDEPCMALCPFLDMFNHGCDVTTTAELKKGDRGWFYELRTSRSYKKYEQVFISYGSHDNFTLLCEYGFFIPWNKFDSTVFTLQEVQSVLKLSITSKQKDFLTQRKLNKDLYVGFAGLSFNLKAVLYLSIQSDVNSWAACAFTENYPLEAMNQMNSFAENLLHKKIDNMQMSLLKVKDYSLVTLLVDYLKYRLELLVHFCEILRT